MQNAGNNVGGKWFILKFYLFYFKKMLLSHFDFVNYY